MNLFNGRLPSVIHDQRIAKVADRIIRDIIKDGHKDTMAFPITPEEPAWVTTSLVPTNEFRIAVQVLTDAVTGRAHTTETLQQFFITEMAYGLGGEWRDVPKVTV